MTGREAFLRRYKPDQVPRVFLSSWMEHPRFVLPVIRTQHQPNGYGLASTPKDSNEGKGGSRIRKPVITLILTTMDDRDVFDAPILTSW